LRKNSRDQKTRWTDGQCRSENRGMHTYHKKRAASRAKEGPVRVWSDGRKFNFRSSEGRPTTTERGYVGSKKRAGKKKMKKRKSEH